MKSLLKNLLKNPKFYLYSLFLITQAALFTAFLIFDFNGVNAKQSNALKYCAVLICLITSALQIYFYKTDGITVALAQFFTAVSDTFLVLYENYEIGVTVFIFAQIVYFIRIYLTSGKNPLYSFILRIVAIVAACIGINFLGAASYLTAVAAIYFVNLLANFAESFCLIIKSRKYILFTVGLFLFICCDVCIGVTQLKHVLNVQMSATVYGLLMNLIWVFYLPSQILIVLSARKTQYKPFWKNKKRSSL